MAEGKLRGVYSTESTTFVGSGTAGRKSVQKKLWAVWDYDEDDMSVQPLNKNLIPSGEKQQVSVREFLEKFRKEPDYIYEDTPQAAPAQPIPAPRAQPAAPAQAKPTIRPEAEPQAAPIAQPVPLPQTEHVERDEVPPEALEEALDQPESVAEKTAPQAKMPEMPRRSKRYKDMTEVEKVARAEFTLALTHLKRGDPERARDMFEKILSSDKKFQPEHKHMFNDFGIGLRKSDMPDVALKHYSKALELSPSDDHLYHNIARVLYDQGEVNQALKHLEKSLELNPDLEVSELFIKYIKKKHKKRFWKLGF